VLTVALTFLALRLQGTEVRDTVGAG